MEVELLEHLKKHVFPNAKHSIQNMDVLLICPLPPMRFFNFAYQLGGIAEICNSKHLELSVLHCIRSLFGDALKTPFSEMQYTLCEMLDFPISAILRMRVGRLLRVKRYFEGPSHIKNRDISLDLLHMSIFCRFLLKTPPDVIRMSLGFPWGGLAAS